MNKRDMVGLDLMTIMGGILFGASIYEATLGNESLFLIVFGIVLGLTLIGSGLYMKLTEGYDG